MNNNNTTTTTNNNNNIHTSVVIELANQEQTEEQKMCKVDLNGSDQPKDYVIDQIFCGENITVYALFEIPEIGGKQSEFEVMEIQNSSNNDDYRFIHKNSYKGMMQQKTKKTVKEIEEDLRSALKNAEQNKSFHCLKHSVENYDIPTREYSGEVKVLFSNDLMSKDPKSSKHKATSKGVNTEITQSPKLIEEVQRAVTGNFPPGKKDGKSVQSSNCTTGKTSYEVIDTDFQASFSSFGSDTEKRHRKKSSPDFLFVPLLMMEDKHKFQKDKNQINSEEKTLGMEAKAAPTKVSFGTNTDAADYWSSMSETEERGGSKCHSSSQCESSKVGKTKLQETSSQIKKKGKETLLNEIRKLQGKLNTLIKSIEFNDLYSSNNEDEDYAETETGTSEEITRKRDSTDSFRRNELDNIPIFPSLDFTSLNKGEKGKPKSKIQSFKESVENTASEDLVKSVSSTVLSHYETIQKFSDSKTPKVKLKNVFSQLNINWESAGKFKSVGSSKSDISNRINLPTPKCAKKSFSFVLRDDKTEVFYLKKMKNSPCKFEGSMKANLRIIQNGEVHLGDNLTPITHEMGDEANRKLRGSEPQHFNKSAEKLNTASKDVTMNMNKSLNEEEGDAKLIYPKQFVQHPAVHYCSTSTLIPDGLLKTVKSVKVVRGKSKTANRNEGSGTKICSDTEKPSTPTKTTKKSSTTESDVKKEVKVPKVLIKNKTGEKKVERRETTFVHDGNKPKSVSGSRKFTVRGTADSKLHVDKLIKKTVECDSKSELNKKAEPSTDEKPGLKIDRLPRPRSQRRKLREKTPETTSGTKKEAEKIVSKIKSGAAVNAEANSKKSSQDVDLKWHEKRNVGPVMVFESAEDVHHDSESGENPAWLSKNPSSVVVELFSKKPSSVDELYSEVNEESQEQGNRANAEGIGSGKENSGSTSSKTQDKPIVKSVWALTKVLLYEDGTKKLEVLEASLTPPGYCLNSTDKSSIEDNSK